jgi:trk system potassium uptake protein TrkH
MKIKWSATKIIASVFALIIFMGAFLLSLNLAARDGKGLPFVDALFTSASATCVTGLVIRDTWTQFSLFGQAVILCLIQVGGLGFMALVVLFSMATRRRIGLAERFLIAETMNSYKVGGVVRLVRRMLIGTFGFELAGAALLAVRFIPAFGIKKGLWISVFQSVSAFCNAGFDLMGLISKSSSLILYAGDPLVLCTIAGLIIVGGIGFIVWNDLVESREEKRKIRLHTRLAIISTIILLISGTIILFSLEYNKTLAGMPLGTKLLNAFFQSVSPRTAGFNSVNMASLSDASKLITMLLMFIGAAPGGTGGGIKVTTFAVIMASLIARLKSHKDVGLFNYRIEAEAVRRSFSTVTAYLGLVVLGTIVLCVGGVNLEEAAFEVFSAIGTVGLSLGITPGLSFVSKLVIIFLMYAGRIGSLTVFMAFSKKDPAGMLKHPVGKVIVG